MGPEPTFKCIAAERSSGLCRKDEVAGLTRTLVQPVAQHCNDRCGQRSDSLLPAFADAADVWTDAQMDVSLPKPDQLGHPEARLALRVRMLFWQSCSR